VHPVDKIKISIGIVKILRNGSVGTGAHLAHKML
jgi:hypothetical protein